MVVSSFIRMSFKCTTVTLTSKLKNFQLVSSPLPIFIADFASGLVSEYFDYLQTLLYYSIQLHFMGFKSDSETLWERRQLVVTNQ